MKKLLLIAALLPLTAQGADFYNYSGRIISDPSGVPLESNQAQFSIDLKVGECVVYREVHSNVPVVSGYFNIKLGKGQKDGAVGSQGIDIFANKTYNCLYGSNSGAPLAASSPLARKALVHVQDGSASIDIGEIEMGSMGQAQQALQLDGIKKDGFIQVVGNVDQAKMDQLATLLPSLTSIISDSGSYAHSSDVTALQSAIALKADASALAAKADQSALTSGLALKADQSSVTSSLALKADVSALASKADASALTSGLALKADQSAVTSALALKADASALSTYALSSYVDAQVLTRMGKISACTADQYLVSTSAVADGVACQSISSISGILTVGGKLQVNAAIVGKDVSITTGSVNFDLGNSISSTLSCAGTAAGASAGDFRLNNLRSGGTYTLVVTSANATKCTFQTSADIDSVATPLTYYFSPPLDVRSGVAGERTVYSFLRVGSDVYVSWATGFKAGQ